MSIVRRIDIADLCIVLHDLQEVQAELATVYGEFDRRGEIFKADSRNPHLCRAGCNHCCKKGAVFAVTLAEAVQWSLAVESLPADQRERSRHQAEVLLARQREIFAQDSSRADVPGHRDEAVFSARIARLNAFGPACPLLAADLCSTYADRPLLCRGYGFPVDAYAVEGGGTIAFRSLCVLYEGMQLVDYIRAHDLKRRLAELSVRMGGGRDWCRFTSIEAILARVVTADAARAT